MAALEIKGRRRSKVGAESIRKSDVTRERIVATSARIFRERGYSGARLIDIANELGLGVGSLYYYFPSREALVEALMERGLRQTHDAVVEALTDLPEDAGPEHRLRAMVECHVHTLLLDEHISAATIRLLTQAPEAIVERHLIGQRAYGELWSRLLEEGQASGDFRADIDPAVARRIILGAMNWAADWYRTGPLGPDDVARQIADVVTRGLLRAPAP